MFSWLYKQSFYVFLPLVSRKKEHIYFNLTSEEDQAKYIVVLHIIYLSLRFFPFLTLIAMVSRKKEHIYFNLTREEDQAKYIVVLHIIYLSLRFFPFLNLIAICQDLARKKVLTSIL